MNLLMRRSVIILTAFVLFFAVWYFNLGVRPFQAFIGTSQTARYLINYMVAGLIPAAALGLLHRPRKMLTSLGMSRGFGPEVLFAVLATLPMLIGYACIGTFDREISADHLLTRVVITGFFDELIFRGFVFGQLFRYARWGFRASGAVGGIAANVLRFGTLAIAVGLTIAYKKRRGLPYFINFKSLIVNYA